VKRVAIYARVSTEDQSLEQQKAVLIEKCKKEGWSYGIFEEKVSGAKLQRTVLDQLMHCIRRREYNCVMVLKLDRLGRSLKHLIQIVEEMNKLNIQFICLSPEINTTSAQGMFFLQIMGAVAQLEREMIRERTIAKLRYLQKKGVKLGRPKGSKDKKVRRRSGYHVRWQKKPSLQKFHEEETVKNTPLVSENNPPLSV
jgi:DNA invertase Pin-like site-specific DNA recombinase